MARRHLRRSRTIEHVQPTTTELPTTIGGALKPTKRRSSSESAQPADRRGLPCRTMRSADPSAHRAQSTHRYPSQSGCAVRCGRRPCPTSTQRRDAASRSCWPAPDRIRVRIETQRVAPVPASSCNLAEGRAGVERTIDHDRRRLEITRALASGGTDERIVGTVPSPRDLQRAHVARIDLRERRILRAASVAAVVRPLAALRLSRCSCRTQQQGEVSRSFSARMASPSRQHLANRRLQLCVGAILARPQRRHVVDALLGVPEQRIETGRQTRLPVVDVAAQRRAVPARQVTDIAVLVEDCVGRAPASQARPRARLPPSQ